MIYFDEVNSAVSWYQNHVGTFDKAKWEQTVEDRILNGITHIATKSTTLSSELIDLDLVQGSSFSKAKAKYGLFTVARHGLLLLIFLPFYSHWWITITSRKLYFTFLSLYILQFINIGLYLSQSRKINNGTDVNGNGNSTLLGTAGQEDIALQPSEILSPIVLMIILAILHSQIIATHSSLYTKKRDDISNSAKKRLSFNQSSSTTSSSRSGQQGRRRGSGAGICQVSSGTAIQLNSLPKNARSKRNRPRYPPSRRRSSAAFSSSPQRSNNSTAGVQIISSKKNEDHPGLRRRQLMLHDRAIAASSQCNSISSFLTPDSPAGGVGEAEAAEYSLGQHGNQVDMDSPSTSLPTTGVVPKLIIQSPSNNNNSNNNSLSSLKNSSAYDNISKHGLVGASSSVNLVVKKVLFEDESPKVQSRKISKSNVQVLISCSYSSNSDRDEGIAEELNSNELMKVEPDDDYHFSLSVHDPIIKRNLAETLSSFERDEGAKLVAFPSNGPAELTRFLSPSPYSSLNDSCTCTCHAGADVKNSQSIVCKCVKLSDEQLKCIIKECEGSGLATITGNDNNGTLNSSSANVTASSSSAAASANLSSSPAEQSFDCITASNGSGVLDGDESSPAEPCLLTNASLPCLTANRHQQELIRRKQSESTSLSCDEDFRQQDKSRRNKQCELEGDGEEADEDEDGNSSTDEDKGKVDGNEEKYYDDDEIRSKSEWTAVTTNSEDEDYVAEEDNDNDNDSEYHHHQSNDQDGFFENHPFAWEFQQGKPLYSPSCTSSDKVSCTIWEEQDAKKADLTVLDISATIIAKVERARENSDYLYLGIVFSVILASLPGLWRLNLDNWLEIDDLYDFLKVRGYLLDTINQTCGITFRSRLMILISSFERLCLSFLVFFLLTVAEKTYKQRFLYSKLFSRITSTRKAKKSGIPHFRLNKVRNIKTWLSVRSYLQRRGPQRSVNIIVSSIFLSTILLVFFLSVELLKDSSRMYFLYNIEVLVWCLFLGVYLLRFMTLGARISQKYKNFSVIITEQLNLYLKMEQKPHKKEELAVANNVLKLASELFKELDDPYKISSFATNPYLYNLTRLIILSAFSGVLSEMLGFKLKLYKMKLK